MGDFSKKIATFIDIFVNQNGYAKVLEGLQNTLLIAVLGLVIGIVIGTIIAVVRVLPKYKVFPRVLNGICSLYVGLFRGTPIVVQLLVFYYVMLPLLGLRMSSVNVAVIVFGLNSGAYISEIMRSGILSVDHGQMEAGRSLGFGYIPTMRHIILPQAFKNVLPPLCNEFIVLLKETAVVGYIGLADLTYAANTVGGTTYEYLFPLLLAAVIYLIMVMFFTALVGKLERRLRTSER